MQPLNSLLRATFLLFSSFFIFQSVNSQPVLALDTVVTGLTAPVDMVAEPGSSRLFVIEQGGTIRIVDGTTILATPFLDISGIISGGGERGLLSMAFHPDYLNPTNRYFFLYYTNPAGDITIGRYQRQAANPNAGDPASGVVLLNIPKSFANHNGGKLNFGSDGMLYFGTGDGGSGYDPDENGQNGNSLLGKMLRLNVDNFSTPPYYTIPADNPFVSNGAVRDEIWALGLRNPWRWSFDRSTGDMWIADVGQDSWEEVNHTTLAGSKGVNFGWRCREGMHATPTVPACTPSGTYVPPIFEYTHNMSTGGFSITGGFVYRGSAFPALNGYFVCADYVSGNVWMVNPDGTSRRQSGLSGSIAGFGEDNNGELYAMSRSNGILFNVIVTAVLPVDLVRFTGHDFPGYNELKWTTAFEENTQQFIVEYSVNGRDYLVAGEVPSTHNSTGDSYSFRHSINMSGTIRYRLRIVDIDAASRYSPVISLGMNDRDIKIYPTIVTTNSLNINAGTPIQKIDIFTVDGKAIHTKDMNGANGYFTLPLPALPKGMYFVRLTGENFQKTEKIFIQ